MGAGLLLFSSSPASARHNFSMLKVADQVVGPGAEVGVSGFSYTAIHRWWRQLERADQAERRPGRRTDGSIPS
jgi:hypothetical protein